MPPLVHYGRAIEHSPHRPGFYYNRGNAYRNKDEYDQAIVDHGRAIELGVFCTNPRKATLESSRLITNCIIYYNMALLSALWTQKKQDGHADDPSAEEEASMLAQISPVAWQHINLGGRYEFGSSPELINLEAIVDRLVRLPLAKSPE